MKNPARAVVMFLALCVGMVAGQQALTNDSVIKLVASGISEEIIEGMIRTQPMQFDLGAEKVLELKKAGVPDKIISAMVNRAAGTSASASTLVAAPNHSPATSIPSVRIQDGTPVRLVLAEELTSANAQVNMPVRLQVEEDVRIGDVLAIPKGSPATGHVVAVQPRGRLGKSGKLEFAVDYVQAHKTNVRLRASAGKDDSRAVTGAMMLGLSGLFVKGKDVKFPKGMPVNAFVDGDREVSVFAEPSPAAKDGITQ